MKKEYILCAAIYFNDDVNHLFQPTNILTGFVICGRRHHNCYAILTIMCKQLGKGIQGFLTSTDRFVDRKEAAKIAFEVGQIEKKVKALISEDLY